MVIISKWFSSTQGVRVTTQHDITTATTKTSPRGPMACPKEMIEIRVGFCAFIHKIYKNA